LRLFNDVHSKYNAKEVLKTVLRLPAILNNDDYKSVWTTVTGKNPGAKKAGSW